MTLQEQVIIVDKHDKEIEVMELNQAHRKAHLHRSISVFIVNGKGEWLLQQRASNCWHSPNSWSNSCSAHPHPGESCQDTAIRELNRQLGIKDASLMELYSFILNEKLNQHITDHELDHVFVGFTNQKPIINTSEIDRYKYIYPSILMNMMQHEPQNYTIWLKLISQRLIKEMASRHVMPRF